MVNGGRCRVGTVGLASRGRLVGGGATTMVATTGYSGRGGEAGCRWCIMVARKLEKTGLSMGFGQGRMVFAEY